MLQEHLHQIEKLSPFSPTNKGDSVGKNSSNRYHSFGSPFSIIFPNFSILSSIAERKGKNKRFLSVPFLPWTRVNRWMHASNGCGARRWQTTATPERGPTMLSCLGAPQTDLGLVTHCCSGTLHRQGWGWPQNCAQTAHWRGWAPVTVGHHADKDAYRPCRNNRVSHGWGRRTTRVWSAGILKPRTC